MDELTKNRVIALLYTLCRDELPTGTVTKIVNDIVDSRASSFDFTNKHLQALVEDLYERLNDR